MSSEFIYYVYTHLRDKDSKTAKAGTPYYVGKGTRKRAWRNHDKTPVPKIVFILEKLSYQNLVRTH